MKKTTKWFAAAAVIIVSGFTFSAQSAYAGDYCAGQPAGWEEVSDNPCRMK